VIDADDATIIVNCLEWRYTNAVETDAFGGGCMTYYLGFLE
jgi:hypothetical protein